MDVFKHIILLFWCLFGANCEEKNFDPNAVSHTTKSELIKSIEAGNEENLIYFCKLIL